jgi:hypothetical protein
MSCTRSVRFELRRNTTVSWANSTFILLPGEPGVDTNTGQMKIGDGVHVWNDLPYVGSGSVPGSTGPTGPAGPVQSIGFDGGNAASVYSIGPVFDCGRAQ